MDPRRPGIYPNIKDIASYFVPGEHAVDQQYAISSGNLRRGLEFLIRKPNTISIAFGTEPFS